MSNLLTALTLYLSTVLSVIVPSVGQARRASISHDIAAVALSEERAFDDDADGRKTALLLTALADYETGHSWAPWIDDGRCNDLAWRTMNAEWLKSGGCDHALAWGMWQVHAPGDDPRIGRTYVTNRRKGISAALFIARASLHSGVGLCGYSGETFPNCPKAMHRLDKVWEWSIRFPFSSNELALQP